MPTASAGSGQGVLHRPPGVVQQYCDWEGFVVEPAAAGEGQDGAFSRAVRGLFPDGVKETSFVATLRTSGVVPAGWETLPPQKWPWGAAWKGNVAFVLRGGGA